MNACPGLTPHSHAGRAPSPRLDALSRLGPARLFTLHVVCMGNLCRSPLAAALFHARVPAGRCTIVSSGLAAQPGRTIDPRAAAVLGAHGLRPLEPAARAFDPASVGQDDLVLAMQQRHLQALRALLPSARPRMHLLGRWTPSQEIDDPIAGTQDDFERTFALIERCVSEWCAHDRRLSV